MRRFAIPAAYCFICFRLDCSFFRLDFEAYMLVGSTRMGPASIWERLSADLAEVPIFLISDGLPGLTTVIYIRFSNLGSNMPWEVVCRRIHNPFNVGVFPTLNGMARGATSADTGFSPLTAGVVRPRDARDCLLRTGHPGSREFW